MIKKKIAKVFGGNYKEDGWDYNDYGLVRLYLGRIKWKLSYFAQMSWINIQIVYIKFKMIIKKI